jgi:hypothetical protein
MTMHKDYRSKYPNNSEICENKVKDLKRNLRSHQAIFSKPINKAKVTTIALYKITKILAKKSNPFEDGNVIKECSFVVGDSLLKEFKTTTEMQLRRSSYLQGLSLEELNVCLMTVKNNWGKILKFVNILAFSLMSQLMSVNASQLLVFI